MWPYKLNFTKPSPTSDGICCHDVMGGIVNNFPGSLSSSCWLVKVLHIISCLPTETYYYYSAEFMSSTAASCQYKRGNQQNQANHSLLNYMHRNFYIFNTAPFLIYPTTRVSHHLQNVYICSQTDHQSIVILSTSRFVSIGIPFMYGQPSTLVCVCQDYLFVHLAQHPFL